jgi:DNA sulfur modification protein DndD
MLFERLLVRNLGVFRGEHSLNLLPPDPQRPIVLVGALNGSGKTTVIEALQLALYGKRAIYGWRGANSYPQYIEHVRNRDAKPVDPTVAEVTLRLSDGRMLRVRRQWSFVKEGPREYVSVFLNGSDQPDLSLSESWEEEIERLLPARLAELFFFDGERIEMLADPAKSADVLRAAVSSLLGLDLVDHLAADLEIMRSRQKQKLLSEADQARLATLESDQSALAQQLEDIRDSKGRCNLRIAESRRALDRVQQDLKALGGDRFLHRDNVAAERAIAAARLASAERQLRDLAAGSLPLILVRGRLATLRDEVSVKAQQSSSESLQLVENHLTHLMEWIATRPYPNKVRAELQAHLVGEVKALRMTETGSQEFVWPELRLSLAAILGSRLEEAQLRASNLAREICRTAESVHTLDEQLAHVPEQEQLADTFRKQGAATTVLQEATTELSSLDVQEQALVRRLEAVKRQRLDELNKVVDASDASRLAEYCLKSIQTLAQFRSNLIRMRREQLERLILEAFQMLSRKADLIGRIHLDPETMAISLRTSEGCELVTQQLSAGERQLLAVAMLWGLARATGRPVPVVIDTPLGRLDGEHRKTLVERYFPDAGHQVILLSTDTEVDAKFSDLLDSSVAHRYLIGYDPKARSSSFVPGYFPR